jgi:hypothetical protein
MNKNALIVFLLMISSLMAGLPHRAYAQDIFSNPFMTSEAIMTSRIGTSSAKTKVTYEIETTTERGAEVSEIVFQLADDWATSTTQGVTQLWDFRLNREFKIDLSAKTFVSTNIVAVPMFLVLERQNRSYLQNLLNAAAPAMNYDGVCNDEMELRLTISGRSETRSTSFERNGQNTKFICAGNEMGSFSVTGNIVETTSFWPALVRSSNIHPQLMSEIRASNKYPTRIETMLKRGEAGFIKAVYRLKSIQEISEPFPLNSHFSNATSVFLDGFTKSNFSQLAKSAITGDVEAKAKTWEQWNHFLDEEIRIRGRAKAALNVFVGYAMFPNRMAQCLARKPSTSCSLTLELSRLRTQDVSLEALLILVSARSKSDKMRAIDVLAQTIVDSDFPHPVLGASVSLILAEGDRDIIAHAISKGINIVPKDQQMKSIAAYPYNPAYWTDFSDSFVREYRISEAMLLLEIAASLPVDGSKSGYQALDEKRNLARRIKNDFPQFFLN